MARGTFIEVGRTGIGGDVSWSVAVDSGVEYGASDPKQAVMNMAHTTLARIKTRDFLTMK